MYFFYSRNPTSESLKNKQLDQQTVEMNDDEIPKENNKQLAHKAVEKNDDEVPKKNDKQLAQKAVEKKYDKVPKKNYEHTNKKLAQKVVRENNDENLEKRQRTGPITRGGSRGPTSARIPQENTRGENPEKNNGKMSQNKIIKTGPTTRGEARKQINEKSPPTKKDRTGLLPQRETERQRKIARKRTMQTIKSEESY